MDKMKLIYHIPANSQIFHTQVVTKYFMFNRQLPGTGYIDLRVLSASGSLEVGVYFNFRSGLVIFIMI